MPNRRHVLKLLAGAGIGSITFQRALAFQAAAQDAVTTEMIQQAEWIAGIELNDGERDELARSLSSSQSGFESLRKLELDNNVAPALYFNPQPGRAISDAVPDRSIRPTESSSPARPASADDLAMLPVTELSALVRTRAVTSVELTECYLDRLKRFDKVLNCVVTLTPELALEQARRADREIAAGRYRGPLHGIPWGAKDLIAVPGYPTTWGAHPYKEQVLDVTATVAERLAEAGAVLVAKLSLGAIAMGDNWFRGRTRNPWDPERGSSGSSAGSASATAAGLVGFSLGTETLGSIVSPCRVCGTSGLRPTFGRVSRHGCMTLSWSMDKVGPICRSVEDCALVFAAIHGHDELDPTTRTLPFAWPPARSLRSMRIGYFERSESDQERAELEVLKSLGATLVPVQLPDSPPHGPLRVILNVESATAFDHLVRTRNLEGLDAWARSWRAAEFVPAVEYVRANRVRTVLMREMERAMDGIDAYVGGNDLTITNLTGHPTVVLPNGFREQDGKSLPRSLTFTGRLYGESDLLAIAHAYQLATGHHLLHPAATLQNAERSTPNSQLPVERSVRQNSRL